MSTTPTFLVYATFLTDPDHHAEVIETFATRELAEEFVVELEKMPICRYEYTITESALHDALPKSRRALFIEATAANGWQIVETVVDTVDHRAVPTETEMIRDWSNRSGIAYSVVRAFGLHHEVVRAKFAEMYTEIDGYR